MCNVGQRLTIGMEKFVESHPAAVPLLVGTGGIPLEDFLSRPPTTWFVT